jgi:PIN domain nuclease of toxin-antitoxin system
MIVLDTHALVWWAGGSESLSSQARAAIEREMGSEQGAILVSAITAWEIAMLVKHERLHLTMDVETWLAAVEAIKAVRFVSVDLEIGVKAVALPGSFHKDPADRIIVATARREAAPLVTADTRILGYPHVRTIW